MTVNKIVCELRKKNDVKFPGIKKGNFRMNVKVKTHSLRDLGEK